MGLSEVIGSVFSHLMYSLARSPACWLTGTFWVRPAPRLSVRATMTPSSTPSSSKARRQARSFSMKSSRGTVTLPSWWPHCLASETWFSICRQQAPA